MGASAQAGRGPGCQCQASLPDWSRAIELSIPPLHGSIRIGRLPLAIRGHRKPHRYGLNRLPTNFVECRGTSSVVLLSACALSR
jgi:hypothetical protein